MDCFPKTISATLPSRILYCLVKSAAFATKSKVLINSIYKIVISVQGRSSGEPPVLPHEYQINGTGERFLLFESGVGGY